LAVPNQGIGAKIGQGNNPMRFTIFLERILGPSLLDRMSIAKFSVLDSHTGRAESELIFEALTGPFLVF
jgi:hypothetical protein